MEIIQANLFVYVYGRAPANLITNVTITDGIDPGPAAANLVPVAARMVAGTNAQRCYCGQ